jgi:hypothetical protein
MTKTVTRTKNQSECQSANCNTQRPSGIPTLIVGFGRNCQYCGGAPSPRSPWMVDLLICEFDFTLAGRQRRLRNLHLPILLSPPRSLVAYQSVTRVGTQQWRPGMRAPPDLKTVFDIIEHMELMRLRQVGS